jgi:hypothetical protein
VTQRVAEETEHDRVVAPRTWTTSKAQLVLDRARAGQILIGATNHCRARWNEAWNASHQHPFGSPESVKLSRAACEYSGGASICLSLLMEIEAEGAAR